MVELDKDPDFKRMVDSENLIKDQDNKIKELLEEQS